MNLKALGSIFCLTWLSINVLSNLSHACDDSIYISGRLNKEGVYSYLTKNMSIASIESCIQKGIGINDIIAYGKSYLQMAVDANRLDVVQFVLEYPSFNQGIVNQREIGRGYPLHEAVRINSSEIVKLLIQHGARHDVVDSVDAQTPLFKAKSREVAELLIGAGADINVKDHWGRTPIFSAQAPRLIEYLVSKGASLDVRDYQGYNPLRDRLTSSGHLQSLISILDENAALLSKDPEKEIRGILLCVPLEELGHSNFYRAVLQSRYSHVAKAFRVKSKGYFSNPSIDFEKGRERLIRNFSHLSEVEMCALIELYAGIDLKSSYHLNREDILKDLHQNLTVFSNGRASSERLAWNSQVAQYEIDHVDSLLEKLLTLELILYVDES
jgi:hypothetical protein